MYRQIILLFFFLIAQLQSAHSQELKRHSFQSYQMGTQFNIILFTNDDLLARKSADDAFNRIEELNQILSDYEEDSELNRLSSTSGSGKSVHISDDLFAVLKESIRMAKLSDGLFDITIGPMSTFWRVLRMSPDPELPTEKELTEFEKKVGYKNIRLNEEDQTAELLKPGMQLDLGGIAKGYAASEAMKVLRDCGIKSALIDAGGDVTLGDPPPSRGTWAVAVPKNQKRGENQFVTIQVANRTVTTSGDLFQFVVIDGERYSHILHPKTGLGTTRQIQATVIAPDGMKADALASVLTLMEPEEGMELINNMDKTEAIIFMNEGGNIREWKSVGVDRFLK